MEEKSNRKGIFWIVIGMVLLMVVLAFSTCAIQKSQKQGVMEMLQRIGD